MKNHEHSGFPCPACGERRSSVLDSRTGKASNQGHRVAGPVRRRRYRCLKCDKRFTTYETIYEPKPSELEDLLTRVVRYREKFGVTSDKAVSVYEAMGALAMEVR